MEDVGVDRQTEVWRKPPDEQSNHCREMDFWAELYLGHACYRRGNAGSGRTQLTMVDVHARSQVLSPYLWEDLWEDLWEGVQAAGCCLTLRSSDNLKSLTLSIIVIIIITLTLRKCDVHESIITKR